MKNKIFELIDKYEKISLFVHEKPDPDALGSAFAFYELIKSNYHQKQIKIIGLDKLDKNKIYNYFLSHYKELEYDESFIKDSLGIIVDTANANRVWTKLNNLCLETIRIDHHPYVENFSNHEIIDDTKSSNCEIIIELIKDRNDLNITNNLIKFLYIGMVADTNRFMYRPNSKTFENTSWLFSFNFDWLEVYNLIFNKSFKSLKEEYKIFKKIKIFKNNICYLKLKSKKINSSKVYLMNNISDFEIFTSIYYDYEDKIWRGSIRSKKIKINDIAEKYHGGGHDLAAGFKINNIKDFKKILIELDEKIKNEKSIKN